MVTYNRPMQSDADYMQVPVPRPYTTHVVYYKFKLNIRKVQSNIERRVNNLINSTVCNETPRLYSITGGPRLP